MTSTPLTATQHAVLAHAIHNTSGKLEWFPENIKGGARKRVIDSLLARKLITRKGTQWFVTAKGFDALGCAQLAPAALTAPPGIEAAMAGTQATQAQEFSDSLPRRKNSKQAQVIEMLKRPEGATIEQICAITGWQSHSVRGAFAGGFKKKLGLTIVSQKQETGGRVYRIC